MAGERLVVVAVVDARSFSVRDADIRLGVVFARSGLLPFGVTRTDSLLCAVSILAQGE